jgi:hypothetical protein
MAAPSMKKENFITLPFMDQCYKTFYGRKLRIFVISWSVLTFLDSKVFGGEARQEPTLVKHLSGVSIKGRLLALPTNNRLSRKS